VLPLGSFTIASTGCTPCNLIACGGGFQWTASASDSSPVAPGNYQVDVTLDGETFVSDCTVVAAADGASTCTAIGSEGSDWHLQLHLMAGASDVDEVAGFSLLTFAERGEGADYIYAGPRTVHIVVTHDDAPFIAVEYDPEYESDDEYWGDPQCGTCESLESANYEWD
jgi:hypothetical protein